MGIWSNLLKKLQGSLAAKEVSPHSWDNAPFAKKELTESEIESFLPSLKIYLGEENFSAIFEKFKVAALHFEKEINFIRNTGEPLNRELALLLSFDIAKIMEKQKFQNIKNLHSVVVYPTYLPPEKEAAGFMMPRGPKGVMEDLAKLKTVLDMANALAELEIERHPLYLDLKDHFKQIKKGMSSAQYSEFKIFLGKIEDHVSKNYTQQRLQKFKAELPPKYHSDDYKILEPAALLEVVDFVKARWETVVPIDQFSVHVSWPHHLQSMAEKGKNLFIHEVAHVLDYQNAHSFSFDSESEWEKLRLKYENEATDFPLEPYAFTNHQEFFAVAAEYYFRHPATLQTKCPDLYDLLLKTYGKVPFDHQPVGTLKILKLMTSIDVYKDPQQAA